MGLLSSPFVVLTIALALFGLSLAVWPPNECRMDEHCNHEEVCINGQCKDSDYLPAGAKCRKNWDCPQVRSLCVEYQCKTNGVAELTTTKCNTTADCSEKYKCIHEFCGIVLMSD